MSLNLYTPPGTGHGDLISLKGFPSIYILPTHLSVDELHELEDEVIDLGGPFTYDPTEATIFLTKVERKTRAAFDLRTKGVWSEEKAEKVDQPAQKRRRVTNFSPSQIVVISDTESEAAEDRFSKGRQNKHLLADELLSSEGNFELPELQDDVIVVKLTWLDESIRQRRLLPLEPFTIYHGRRIQKPDGAKTPNSSPASARMQKIRTSASTTLASSPMQPQTLSTSILTRAKAEADVTAEKGHPMPNRHRRRFKQPSFTLVDGSPVPKLTRMTTSEFEDSDERTLPEAPEWVKSKSIYSCLRTTPLVPVNQRFIRELYKIKESRILTLDQIGIRAYSTSIASLSAYPFLLQSPLEVLRLPGCDERIASLFSEYKASASEESDRYLPAAKKLDEDENLQCLKSLYKIWGCGAETARKMYFSHGWKDIDDVVEFGWNTLTRAQQIGVKFYDEFQLLIPRTEVEQITQIIKSHARNVRAINPNQHNTHADIVAIIVGGYRRGKPLCGDVDVILSHRDESITKNLIVDLVSALEDSNHITHTLTLNTSTTNRGQQTLPYNAGHGGHGFDSLDKALCVWQDPIFSVPSIPHTTLSPSSSSSSSNNNNDNPAATAPTSPTTQPPNIQKQTQNPNPNPHRRVDIIVSPWRTIGAAVLGWSGATTFERDLRRWCKRERGWKFDSSGVRDRGTGRRLDLEGGGRADGDDEVCGGDGWEERERRLMVGLGIGWVPPELRCTG